MICWFMCNPIYRYRINYGVNYKLEFLAVELLNEQGLFIYIQIVKTFDF